MADRPTAVRGAGFTLMEIIVVMVLISLLAGSVAPLAVGQIRGQRVRATTERMQNVVLGMVGDPVRGGHGYLGDLGALPRTLEDLNSAAGMPGYAIDPNDGIGFGYNGPYVPQIGASSAPFVDAWGTPLFYDPAVAQVASAGPDRAIGTADDLVHPNVAPVTTGNLSVTVVGVPNDAGAPCLLGEDDADVFVARAIDGQRREMQLLSSVGSGAPFLAEGIHKGLHGVRFVGEGAFAGASVRDVVEIRGGSAQLRATLLQPAGAPAACGGSGGGGAVPGPQPGGEDDDDDEEEDEESGAPGWERWRRDRDRGRGWGWDWDWGRGWGRDRDDDRDRGRSWRFRRDD